MLGGLPKNFKVSHGRIVDELILPKRGQPHTVSVLLHLLTALHHIFEEGSPIT